jgi:molybdopterin-synthase adenylyltransferase
VRPQLKGSLLGRDVDGVVILSEFNERIVLEDESGDLEALLKLLGEGVRSRERVVEKMLGERPAVSEDDVFAALGSLDELGLVFDAEAANPMSGWQRERYFSNLAFFGGFASLSHSAADYQQRLLDAHVVVLGVGGLGSVCLMCMAGLGVGRLTLVDDDAVELRNFVRQFIYRERDIGQPKVERAAAWAQQFDPTVKVHAIKRRISGPEDVAPLLGDADLVIAGVDHPPVSIDLWVNEACVAAGVPYVRGGCYGREVMYWSVDPGRTPCRACEHHNAETNAELLTPLEGTGAADGMAGNRGVGPVAGMLGSLVALEGMRYLTGIAPPAAAGMYRRVDICTATEETQSWQRWPDCPVCASAPEQPPRQSAYTAARFGLSV